MKESKFIKCENLKTQANKIFKGLIKEAYIEWQDEESKDFGNYNKKENAERKNYFDNALYVDDQHKELRYDARTIVFEFINGTIVEFSNSEWGSMSVVDENNLAKELNKEDYSAYYPTTSMHTTTHE
jgi:hypothetical protein